MKEKVKYIFILILVTNLVGCSGQPLPAKKHNNYIKQKSKVDTIFIGHFPNSVETEYSQIVSNESPEANKVSLYLYEFGVNITTLDSLTKIVNSRHFTKYKWSDSCLFIVHPNETTDPFDEEFVDTSIYNIDCIDKKLPIPNFIHTENPKWGQGNSLDSTFNIYVIESKSGTYSRYKMKPLESMPIGWKNGFSRGLAISNEKAVVVYWMIVW